MWFRRIFAVPLAAAVCCGLSPSPAVAAPPKPAATPRPTASPTPAGAGQVRGATRKVLLDALRPTVEKDVGRKVRLYVDTLRVVGDWAFWTGRPVRADTGGPLDYRRTRYAAAVAAGAFDDGACALLRRVKGRWTVVAYNLGATDVVWDGWDVTYRAPRAVFPYGDAGRG